MSQMRSHISAADYKFLLKIVLVLFAFLKSISAHTIQLYRSGREGTLVVLGCLAFSYVSASGRHIAVSQHWLNNKWIGRHGRLKRGLRFSQKFTTPSPPEGSWYDLPPPSRKLMDFNVKMSLLLQTIVENVKERKHS